MYYFFRPMLSPHQNHATIPERNHHKQTQKNKKKTRKGHVHCLGTRLRVNCSQECYLFYLKATPLLESKRSK